MPRGRFQEKSYYDNYRLNSLPLEAHFLFGGIVVVCADREGCCKGDTKWINNQVFSLRDYTDRQIEGWLDRLWETKDDDTGLGLIERYSVNGRPYIWLPGFEKHQRGRHKDREAESDIPPPPESLLIKARKYIVESKAEDKSKEEIKTDDLKVAGMITYYEKELGRTLTPTDYERLKDFADTYPDGWFEQAVDEAVKNKAVAPMPYIEKIMEKKLADGKHRKDDKGSRVEKLKQFRDG